MNRARSFVTLAFLTSLPLLACAGSTVLDNSNDAGTGVVPSRPLVEASALPTAFDVEADTRKAWLADAQWTELYVLSALDNLPDSVQASAQISQARSEVVAEMQKLIGSESAAELATRLQARDEAMIAYVNASDSADGQLLLRATNEVYATADAVATYVANQKMVMSYGDAQAKLHDEATAFITATDARVSNDFGAMTAAFDLMNHHAMLFAEALSNGVSESGARNLGPTVMSVDEQVFRLSLRTALDGQAYWTRVFMVERMANDSATQPVLDLATQTSVDAGKVFQSTFDDNVGAQVQYYVHAQLADAVAYVLAHENGDAATIAGSRAQWDADADAFAQYLWTADAHFKFLDLDRQLRLHVDRSASEIDARALHEYDADATDYGNVVDNLDTLADELAAATFVKGI